MAVPRRLRRLCAILVGELNAAGTGVDYLPVNSCLQLLPTLDGKSVKTIESLKRADGSAAPGAAGHGGLPRQPVRLLHAGRRHEPAGLMNTLPQPSRAQITDALSGNPCRCTGYKPIIDAAPRPAQPAPWR